MGHYSFTELTAGAGAQLYTAVTGADGADHHLLAPLGYLRGKVY